LRRTVRRAVAPGRWSWQVISRTSKDSQKMTWYSLYNFIITAFYCQDGSQGGGISARAFALARPGVAPPLSIGLYSKWKPGYWKIVYFNWNRLWISTVDIMTTMFC